MSQGFKLRYDQMRDGDPSKTDQPSKPEENDHVYRAASHARSLCLVWPDGNRKFFNYAYLISGEFDAAGDKNIIRLNFSSCLVLLQGYGLEELFMLMMEHTPRIIQAVDERYVLATSSQDAMVVDIVIEKKDT